jgi:hypothetical protein
MSNRWRADAIEARVDPHHDGNAFSFYYPSRLDIHRTDGSVWDCEDMRAGCAGMVATDGFTGTYSYVTIATRPDALTGPGATITAPGPDSIYAQQLTGAQIAKLAAQLPKNLAATIASELTALLLAGG